MAIGEERAGDDYRDLGGRYPARPSERGIDPRLNIVCYRGKIAGVQLLFCVTFYEKTKETCNVFSMITIIR